MDGETAQFQLNSNKLRIINFFNLTINFIEMIKKLQMNSLKILDYFEAVQDLSRTSINSNY